MLHRAAEEGTRVARRGVGAAFALFLLIAPARAEPANSSTDPAFLTAQQQLLFQQMQQDPANLDVILAYAEVSARLGDNEAAVSALQRLLLFNPDLPRVNLELGALYFRMGSFGMARAYLEKAAAANPPPEVKERIDRYLARIVYEDAPAHLTGSLMLGAQYQSDANVAPASALINSPVGPLLLNSEFVKKSDENLFLAGSVLYSQDLGSASRDTFEVTGTGFLQHYFRVQRLALDFGEVTAGPRFQFPDPGLPGVQSASLKPYAILNEVGLGQNQYFYTYGGGVEGTASLWPDLTAKLSFELRHKTFSNAPDRPQSTGLGGDDKLVSLALAKALTENSMLTADFDFLDQDTSLPYYSNKSYAASAAYRVRYDDPTGLVGLPWETTVWGSRLWSFYGAPDPCCNTSRDPTVFIASDQRTRRWRFGLSQVFQLAEDLGLVVQYQRDIVSSNLPLYGYTSNSVLIGPQLRFGVAAGAASADSAGEAGLKTSDQPSTAIDYTQGPGYRLEGSGGGTFASNGAKASLTTRSLSLSTNNVTLTGTGFTGGAALWVDGPLALWTGNPALANFSFGLEYRHFNDSESANVTATIPAFGSIAGTATANFDAENLMVDAAWRLNGGDLHPYLGVGGGIALVDWNARLKSPVLSLLAGSTASSLGAGIITTAAAGHGFAGLDYDVTPQFYLGAGADFYFTGTAAKHFTHSNIQLNANQLALLAHAGYRF